jgi:hypothetical protein
MIRFGIAIITALLTFASQAASADGFRKYTPGDLYVGTGNPNTPLVVGDNPIVGSDAQIACGQPSCMVLATIDNRFCSSEFHNFNLDIMTKVYADGELVGGQWVEPDVSKQGCRAALSTATFEIHSGNHILTLSTYWAQSDRGIAATQGPWNVSYQVAIPQH